LNPGPAGAILSGLLRGLLSGPRPATTAIAGNVDNMLYFITF